MTAGPEESGEASKPGEIFPPGKGDAERHFILIGPCSDTHSIVEV